VFQENQKQLQPLLDFVSERGRFPRAEERAVFGDTAEYFGGLGRASKLIRSVVPEDRLQLAARRAREDLLVYLALTHFSAMPKLKELDRTMQHDIKNHLGSYTNARDESKALLFSLGDRAVLNAAWTAANVGKTLPSHFYIHCSAIDKLPPVLRLYEGCARQYLGAVEGATLIKLGLLERTVSYLYYPRFDQDPHPALSSSLTVDLQNFRTKWRNYSESHNPPILHRKELFVAEDYPHRPKFNRLSRQEERAGLFNGSSAVIGRVKGWQVRLEQCRVTLKGHRVVNLP
jgi:DNA phosphorothioation-associated putative methyltransferase